MNGYSTCSVSVVPCRGPFPKNTEVLWIIAKNAQTLTIKQCIAIRTYMSNYREKKETI